MGQSGRVAVDDEWSIPMSGTGAVHHPARVDVDRERRLHVERGDAVGVGLDVVPERALYPDTPPTVSTPTVSSPAGDLSPTVSWTATPGTGVITAHRVWILPSTSNDASAALWDSVSSRTQARRSRRPRRRRGPTGSRSRRGCRCTSPGRVQACLVGCVRCDVHRVMDPARDPNAHGHGRVPSAGRRVRRHYRQRGADRAGPRRGDVDAAHVPDRHRHDHDRHVCARRQRHGREDPGTARLHRGGCADDVGMVHGADRDRHPGRVLARGRHRPRHRAQRFHRSPTRAAASSKASPPRTGWARPKPASTPPPGGRAWRTGAGHRHAGRAAALLAWLKDRSVWWIAMCPDNGQPHRPIRAARVSPPEGNVWRRPLSRRSITCRFRGWSRRDVATGRDLA